MVTPALKLRVPIKLIPVTGEAAMVAPEAIQVNRTTPQLSENTGSGTTTEAAQVPAATVALKLEGQLIVGKIKSTTVTVATHVLVLPDKSAAVTVTLFVPRFEQLKLFGDTPKEATPQLSALLATI